MYRTAVVFSGLAIGIFLIAGCDGGFTGGVDVPIGNPNITIEQGDVIVDVDQTQENEQAVEVVQDQVTGTDSEDESGGNRVEICHIPPGNPDRAHTIVIDEAALPAHLAHGDWIGECECEWGNAQDCDDDDLCTVEECIAGECIYTSIECDDGDACTTDLCDPDTGECRFEDIECDDGDPCTTDWCDPDTGECVFQDIDCDDEDLCTIDWCDPETGECVFEEIVCDDDDLCTTDECDPETGECVFTPVECPEGQVCDPDTGECVECLTDDDCDDGNLCIDGECVSINLALEYHFDEAEGCTVADSSSNGYHGTQNDCTDWGTPEEAFAGASCFENENGNNTGVVEVPPEALDNLECGAVDFRAMLYSQGGTGFERTILTHASGINQDDISIGSWADAGFWAQFREDGGADLHSGPVSTHVWYHVRVEWTGTEYRMYLDDELVHSESQTRGLGTKSFCHIGRGLYGNQNRPWHGRIDEFRIEILDCAQGPIVNENFSDGPGCLSNYNADVFTVSGGVLEVGTDTIRGGSQGGLEYRYALCDAHVDSDFVLDVDLMVVDTQQRRAGVVYGWTGAQRFYLFQLNDYEGYDGGGGVLQLFAFEGNGSQHTVAEKVVDIVRTEWYTVRIDVTGERHRVFLNGDLELDGIDDDYTGGQIGLAASFNGYGWFDNLWVTEP